MKKQKPIEWLKRYLPSEIAGTITALIAAYGAKYYGSSLLVIAYAGSIGEAFGFYSIIFIQQIITEKKKHDHSLKFQNYLIIIASMLMEFGPAGLLDDLLIRPFFMYWFPILFNNFSLGIIAGKIAGDICFYFLAILSYEFIKKKKRIKNNGAN